MKVGIDIGYGFTKAVCDKYDQKIIFPSAVSEKIFVDKNFGLSAGKKYLIEYNNKVYGVGEEAIWSGGELNFTDDRFVSEHAKILVLTALCALNADSEVELGLGLPISLFRTGLAEKVQNYFEFSEDTVIFGDKPKRFHITRCEVFAQGVGALFSLDEQIPEGMITIIDVGFKTTDVLTIKNDVELDYEPNLTFTIDYGVSAAVERISLILQRKCGVSYDTNFLMDIENKNSVMVRGRKVDITQIKEESLTYIAGMIADEILRKFQKKLDILSGIYITGGGAEILYNKLKHVYENVKIMPDNQFANAKGYLKLLALTDENNPEKVNA